MADPRVPRHLLKFLNSRDERTFGRHAYTIDRDALADPSAMQVWLSESIGVDATVGRAEWRAAVELRDLLRRYVDGDPAGADLDAAAARQGVRVSFSERPSLVPLGSGASAFLGSIIASCAELAAVGRWRRVKMCAAPDCRFVFYDRGRNALGRWCAMESCGNRTKARRYRARHGHASGSQRAPALS
jgi:predicted RNA-binding Zn ribbon-like protein